MIYWRITYILMCKNRSLVDQSMPTTQPIALENRLQGKLHVRLGNVGFPSDPRFRRSGTSLRCSAY